MRIKKSLLLIPLLTLVAILGTACSSSSSNSSSTKKKQAPKHLKKLTLMIPKQIHP